MRAGDSVQWIVEGGVLRVGVYVRTIAPGAEPTLPSGVGRTKRRFRPRPSSFVRALVRDVATGCYHAPREESLEAAKDVCEA